MQVVAEELMGVPADGLGATGARREVSRYALFCFLNFPHNLVIEDAKEHRIKELSEAAGQDACEHKKAHKTGTSGC